MHTFDNIMLVITGHRILIIALIALGLWLSAYYLYAKRYFRGFFKRSRPHSWSVDMVNKRAMSRGKFEA
jgi:hypothetical protein